MPNAKNGLRHDIIVEAGVTAAFEIFTAHIGDWWPLAYTFSGPDFAGASIDSAAGGIWSEQNAQGESLAWGEVRIYEREERLVLGFAIGPDREPVSNDAASEVEVRFRDAGPCLTHVQIEHRDFERHGDGAAALSAGMNSPQGWPLILAAFKRWIGARSAVRYIVEDINPAVAFYTGHLGFVPEISAARGFAALSRGAIRLYLNEPTAVAGGRSFSNETTPHPGGWNRLQLRVANLDSEIRRLRAARCSFRTGAVEGRGGRQILLSDPSGNLIELFEPFSRTSPRTVREHEPVAD